MSPHPTYMPVCGGSRMPIGSGENRFPVFQLKKQCLQIMLLYLQATTHPSIPPKRPQQASTAHRTGAWGAVPVSRGRRGGGSRGSGCGGGSRGSGGGGESRGSGGSGKTWGRGAVGRSGAVWAVTRAGAAWAVV
jgi:hypothetical protein